MDTPDHRAAGDRPGHPTIPAEGELSRRAAAPGEGAPADTEPGEFLSWPPPGLARVRGDAYLAARWLAAGSVLILPLLAALVLQDDPWTLGIGDGYWLAVLLGIAGIPVIIGGFLALNRLLDRARKAAEHGYGWRLIALAACDQRGDTGFLVQGARVYSTLTAAQRRWLAGGRMLTGALFLGAAMWLSVGFGLAVVLAARGVFGPAGVALLTLGPSMAGALVAVALYAWEESILGRARKTWYGRPWSAEMEAAEVHAWKAALRERADGLPLQAEGPGTRRALRIAGIGTLVAMLVAFVPVFLLIFASTVAPIVTMISMPRSSQTQRVAAGAEALRPLVLEPDASISGIQAGEILHLLSFVGNADEPDPLLRPPVRRYAQPVLPSPTPAWLQAEARGIPVEWFLDLLDRPDAPLEPDQLAYLQSAASHPAHEELATLARAGTLDAAATRWRTPLPADRSYWSLPLPRHRGIREVAYAHIGRAALEVRERRYDDAEITAREVLSAGMLLTDQGSTLLDNLVGAVMARLGADALERVWRASGRNADADALTRQRAAAERAAEMAAAGMGATGGRTLRAFPAIATDTLALRGLRWEMFALVSAASSCLNPRRIVFGPDAEHEAWAAEARELLVTSPAEAELFELARRGGSTGVTLEEPSVLTRFVTLTMGGVDREGSCGRALASIIDGP